MMTPPEKSATKIGRFSMHGSRRWVLVLLIVTLTVLRLTPSTEEAGIHKSIVAMPKTVLTPQELGIIININDPVSVNIGEYYRQQREIPSENLIRVKIPIKKTLSPEEFKPIYQQIIHQTPRNVQAYGTTWLTPFRVDRMSMTSAIALGYDPKYQGQPDSCQQTAVSPLFNYIPKIFGTNYRAFNIRPTMAITGYKKDQVIKLIDKGKLADGRSRSGTAYLMRTSDESRSVRYAEYKHLQEFWNQKETTLKIDYIDNSNRKAKDIIKNKKDVMFYLQGLSRVGGLDSLYFLPGAIADHLTSNGGILIGSDQMNILEFIKFGATASYGTVVEPCNFTDKFPDARFLVDQYYRGRTAIEAYWLSVKTPGEGIFVGDPLARPFGFTDFKIKNNNLTITTSILDKNVRYKLEVAKHNQTNFSKIQTIEIKETKNHQIFLKNYDSKKKYRLKAECDIYGFYDDLKDCS